jgi:NAD(P)-dependent dehydrogenase (short-subunit alcohol dehydrogenase family)|tara:strand:+ start:200 stop:1051 length:852 start_codon:yes stop_codon:yes gene_type:complete
VDFHGDCLCYSYSRCLQAFQFKGEIKIHLENQVAIVTGAGRGIGKAIAIAFAAEGADVVATARTTEEIKNTCHEIEALGRQGLAIPTDVTKVEQIGEMVEKAVSYFGKIDILVNNAGIIKLRPVLELTEAEWDRVIDTNLKGVFLCSQAAAKHMIKQNHGKIINIASIGAHIGSPGGAAYATSKGGIIQLTKVLAVELGKYNINVNAVSPGLTMTAMADYLMKERPNAQDTGRIPLGRLAKPEDIANAVLYLASTASDYVTGQEIIVDGGSLVINPRLIKPVG